MIDNLRCSVTNCVYNSNNLCTANHVDIYPVGNGFANSSEGTGCKTFKPKDQHPFLVYK